MTFNEDIMTKLYRKDSFDRHPTFFSHKEIKLRKFPFFLIFKKFKEIHEKKFMQIQ